MTVDYDPGNTILKYIIDRNFTNIVKMLGGK